MELFNSKADELFCKLGTNQIMVLATSANNRVTARSMSFVIDKGKFYFQTEKSFCKYQQIKSNPHIAVCLNNIQIEGECNEIGHPLEERNLFFAEKYEQYYKGSFDKYSHISTETVFEISPALVTLWCYEDGKPFREFYDFNSEVYRKEYCVSIQQNTVS